MGATYWLNRGTAAEGPYGEAQILELIARGLRAANVCADGASAWQPLTSVPAFAAALAPPVSVEAAMVGATLAPDDPRIDAIVARGYASRLGCVLPIAVFILVGLSAMTLFVLQPSHDLDTTAGGFAIVGGVWLLTGLFFGRARVVADGRGIGRAIGRRASWSEYERDEPTSRVAEIQNRVTRIVTRTIVRGTRFHFRGGRTFLAEGTMTTDVAEQIRAFGRLAASRAQPHRAAEILRGIGADVLASWSAPARPFLGGRLPTFAMGFVGLALLATVGVAYPIEAARRRERTARASLPSPAELREREAEAAARALVTYPTSPGLLALQPDGICPLLVGWDLSCRAEPDGSSFGLRDVYEVRRAGEAARVRIWAWDFARAEGPRNVGDERAFVLVEPAGEDAERALATLATHRFRGPDEFVGALRTVHLRTPGADTIWGRGAFVCFQSEVHFRAGRRWLRGCDWSGEAEELVSTVVERAGDRVVVIRGESVTDGNTALAREVRDILLGTATPPR